MLMDVRDGLAHISALPAVLPTTAIHMTAERGARAAWSCPPEAAMDAFPAEVVAAAVERDTTWDLAFVNGPAATATAVAARVVSSLAPGLVRAATQSFPDCLRLGVS